MADTGIFCDRTDVLEKAGANVNATYSAEAYTNSYIAQAESLINVICRYNFSDNYASLNADVKKVLEEAASNLAAIYVINADYSSIVAATDIIEAEDRITVLRDSALRAISVLKDKKAQDFINGA